MALLVKIEVLIDETDANLAIAHLEQALSTASQPAGEYDGSWLVDWSIDLPSPVHEEINDSIVNKTYQRGDFQKDFVIFSASEARASDDCAGFWSNEYGWTILDLATRFSAVTGSRPISVGMDATWMHTPNGLRAFTILLIEFPQDSSLDQTPIAFDCWAEDEAHAREQAENAYDGCKILECAFI